MLNTNYIIKFLGSKQEEIDQKIYEKIKPFELNKTIDLNKYLNDSFEVIFNKSLKDFYYENKSYTNKSLIFTFINSILSITNHTFEILTFEEKEKTIKDFIMKMDKDLFGKNLYNEFEYNKNKFFSKSNIQVALSESFLYKNSEQINLLKQYIADYLGINIYVFKIFDNQFDIKSSELYFSTKYRGIQKYLPSVFILKVNQIYRPLLINSDNVENSIITYSVYKDIIDNIWRTYGIDKKQEELQQEKQQEKQREENELNESIQVEIQENIQGNSQENKKEEQTQEPKLLIDGKINKFTFDKIKNLKVDELRELCKENDIETVKKSDKTMKLINKLKSEMIDDLLALK